MEIENVKNDIKDLLRVPRAVVAIALAACAWCVAPLSAATAAFDDGVDRTDPNFVRASLLILGPGQEFFGCAGHASLRLECPKFNLDYCFSCESEPIKLYPFRFVMGNLKMGMLAIPTKDFLVPYAQLGRRATLYPLTLPPDAKQRLWKMMDDMVQKGDCLHYDYIKYCCVQSVLQPILEAIRPYEIQFAPWPEQYELTRREILANELSWCPWTRLFLHTIAGTGVDEKVSKTKTVILSPDLVALLRGAKVLGKPIIEGEGEVLLDYQRPVGKAVITPMMVAVGLLALAVARCFRRLRWVDLTFLTIQSLIGLLLTHLLVVSNLPATSWNWLVIPFNPLPLVFWKWRRLWALPFAAVLVLWTGFMALYPHQLTDTAYLVLAFAYFVFYMKISENRLICSVVLDRWRREERGSNK